MNDFIQILSLFIWRQGLAFLAGACAVLFPKFVDEWFNEKREKRKSRQKFVEQFSALLLDAEETNWSEVPISEAKFTKMCRQLSQYNWRLADKFRFNYFDVWMGVLSDQGKSYSEMTKEEQEQYIDALTDLKALNKEFQDFAFPDQKFQRHLAWAIEDLRIRIKHRFIRIKKSFKLYPFRKNEPQSPGRPRKK